MSSARIAVPAPEHACRYDGKSPPALVALRLMPVFMPGMRGMPGPGKPPAGAYGPDNIGEVTAARPS
jgi:hypothetical protein